ncbi:MAG: flagellar basal body rod protein FlgB [Ignavibacteriales bacterium]|nr:flagellar basal body rod protein FlgB [Ignavibacteriales bacterium]
MASEILPLMERFIDWTAKRGQVINKNIANVNTEYYKREEVPFDAVMKETFDVPFKQTREGHVPLKSDDDFPVVKDDSIDPNNGLNNVMIDREMSDLAENTLLFKFASKKINGHFAKLQEVIKGDR